MKYLIVLFVLTIAISFSIDLLNSGCKFYPLFMVVLSSMIFPLVVLND